LKTTGRWWTLVSLIVFSGVFSCLYVKTITFPIMSSPGSSNNISLSIIPAHAAPKTIRFPFFLRQSAPKTLRHSYDGHTHANERANLFTRWFLHPCVGLLVHPLVSTPVRGYGFPVRGFSPTVTTSDLHFSFSFSQHVRLARVRSHFRLIEKRCLSCGLLLYNQYSGVYLYVSIFSQKKQKPS
jgi:hypothetical protein